MCASSVEQARRRECVVAREDVDEDVDEDVGVDEDVDVDVDEDVVGMRTWVQMDDTASPNATPPRVRLRTAPSPAS